MLSPVSRGFLLIECMLAFAVLSLSILICAHSFLSVVREYRHAKERLELLNQAQYIIESSWMSNVDVPLISNNKIMITTEAVEGGIVLPTIPNLKQVWIEIVSPVNNERMLKIRSRIKEA